MRVVLPSNSSMQKYFPDNTLSSYSVKLANALDFSVGKWEGALTEIQFFKSWHNVTEAVVSLIVDGETSDIKIPNSYYSSPFELVNTINQSIDDEWKLNKNYDVKLEYAEHSKQIRFTAAYYNGPGLRFEFNDSLKKLFGFTSGRVVTGNNEHSEFEGGENVRLEHLYDLMVYSNIVQSSIIGDIESPLLRVVSIEPGHWTKQCTIYQNPQYLPLSKTKFQNISIPFKN